MPSMAITVVTRRGLDSGSVSLLRSPPVKKAANMKKRAIAHIDQIVMFQNVCSDIFASTIESLMHIASKAVGPVSYTHLTLPTNSLV